MKYLEGFWMWQLISNDDDYTTTLFLFSSSFSLLNGIVDTCTTGKQSRGEEKLLPPVENGWIFRDFPWENFPHFLLPIYILVFFLLRSFAMGKSFFYSLRPSTLFLLTHSVSLFRFHVLPSFLSYKVSTYGIYLYIKMIFLRCLLRCDFMIMTLGRNWILWCENWDIFKDFYYQTWFFFLM